MEAVHRLKDVECQLAGSTMVTLAFALRSGHVGYTETAAVFRVGARQRDGLEGILPRQTQANRTAKRIRIGNRKRSLAAINLDARQFRRPDIKAGQDCTDRAAGKIDDAGNVRGHFNMDDVAVFRFACDRPLGKCQLRAAGHPSRRSKQAEKGRQIIGTHIKHRAAADLIVEFGIRMPAFVAMAGHERRGANRPADGAGTDQIDARLNTGTHERIRSAAKQQVFLIGQGFELTAILQTDGKRFFHINGLAGCQGLAADIGMIFGRGDVQDDIDLGIMQEFVGADDSGDTELGRLPDRLLGNQFGDCLDFDCFKTLVEIFQINAADVAAANHTDACTLHVCILHMFVVLRFDALRFDVLRLADLGSFRLFESIQGQSELDSPVLAG